MKSLALFIGLFTVVNLHAQTGIGTATPNSSAKLEVYSTNKGFLPPRVTLTSATDNSTIASPAVGLLVYNTGSNANIAAGYYYWNGTGWATIATASGNSGSSTYGDIKTGIQTADHNGWVKLDGRLKSSLTTTQQTQATALGIGANLPNATNAFLVQNGTTLGSVSGSSAKTITQSNLPNIAFSGSTDYSGDHSHVVDPPNTYTSTNGNHSHYFDDYYFAENRGWNNRWFGTGSNTDGDNDPYSAGHYTGNAGDHNHTVDIAAFYSANAGSHTHGVTVYSGGSGAALDVTPKSLSVNTFIYLGN